MIKRFIIFLYILLLSTTVWAQPVQHESLFVEESVNVYLNFDGQWLPDIRSELLGAQNYKTQQNMRPIDGGIEGVCGYSKINTTVSNINYYKPRSGYHFKKDRPAESHILTQFYNFDGTQSKIFQNKIPIPGQGNFETDAIHDDESYGTFTGTYGHHLGWVTELYSSGATHGIFVGSSHFGSGTTHGIFADDIDVTAVITHSTPRARFSKGPMGTVIYSNGVESQVWGGDASRVAAFIVSSADVTEYVTDARDYSEQINNEYETASDVANVSGASAYWLVGSPRPISGISYYCSTVNATAGQFLKVSEWNGTTWAELVETDGTVGLSQASGKVTFPSTVGTSKPKYMEGKLLYYYLCQLSSGGASIYNVTLDIPWQNLVDLWDGVPRTPISFQASRSDVYKDWTLEVNISEYDIGAELGGLTATDHIIIGFRDRIQAIQFEMLSGNTNPFGPNTTVSYWNGSTYVASGVTYDATGGFTGVAPLGQTGALKWEPPDRENEFSQFLFGEEGYFYEIAYGGTLGGAGAGEDLVAVDVVYGVPAPLKLNNFKFATFYKNRVFLCGYLKGNTPNRVDFSLTNSPDAWNGIETSDDGRNSLYVGGGEELTAAIQILNRYGANIYNNLLFFKNNEIHSTMGGSPTELKKNLVTISETIGCPAPYTLISAEVGYELIPGELQRNIVFWLSSTGPYLFDGTVPIPIRGIDSYFDKENENYVGAANLVNAFAWYDSDYAEWNLRVGDHSFVYDFVRKKWYTKDTGTAEKIQCAFQVQDTNGAKYIYGGTDDGYLNRLEYGTTWDGVGIEQIVETGDFFLDGMGWHECLLRRLKLDYKVLSEVATVQVEHFKDTASTGTSIFSVALNSGDNVSNRNTRSLDIKARRHRLKLSVTTSGTTKGFQPPGWGYQYNVVREDN